MKNIESNFSTLDTLFKTGEKTVCQNVVSNIANNKNNIIKSARLDVKEAERIAEEITDKDNFYGGVFIAPINMSNLIKEENDDRFAEYWDSRKDIIANRIELVTGLKYCSDFAILNKGLFSIVVFMTVDEDGDYFPGSDVAKYYHPSGYDYFGSIIDFYYKNTDNKFFCINVLSFVNKDEKCSTKMDMISLETKGLVVEGIQVDISFLRSETFKFYDFEEGREHRTYNIFKDALIHSISMEHRVVSYDSEMVDMFIDKISNKVCYRR